MPRLDLRSTISPSPQTGQGTPVLLTIFLMFLHSG